MQTDAAPSHSSPETANLPGRPVLGAGSRSGGSYHGRSALTLPYRRWTSSGRAAIALALTDAGLAPGSSVLIPAYNCPSMIEPLVLLGLRPVFYDVDQSLAFRVADLESRLDGSVKAMMLTHYFGVPQDALAARAFCDRHGLILIEDCAHAFFGPVGQVGDYATFSLPKFFPVLEGGMLASARRDLSALKVSHPGIALELKAAWWAYDHADSYGHRPAGTWVYRIARHLKRLLDVRQGSRGARAFIPAAAEGGAGLEAHWVDKLPSFFSRWAVMLSSHRDICARRQANLGRLAAGLGSSGKLRLIETAFPPAAAPYVLAVEVLDDVEAVYRRVKVAGVPVFRWDEPHPMLDLSTFAWARRYAHSVLQFPVHQSLSEQDIEKIVRRVHDALDERSSRSLGESAHAS
jgi:perosamine synthetase